MARTDGVPASRGNGERRIEILKVAAELFARLGYHGTGMAELTHALDLGRGGLYHHIGSKEALLYEISANVHEQMNLVATRVVESDATAEEKLTRLAHDLLNHLAAHAPEWTVAVRDSYVLSPERWDAIRVERDRYEAAWQTVLEQGEREGMFKPVPRVVIKGILGLFNNAWQWYKPGGAVTPDELADEYLSIVLDGLRVEARRSSPRATSARH